MITSKEIINKSGISRATLNNYIKLGILPKPVVMKPQNHETKARMIGYFHPSVLDRIAMVKSMKKDGHSIKGIAVQMNEVVDQDAMLQISTNDLKRQDKMACAHEIPDLLNNMTGIDNEEMKKTNRNMIDNTLSNLAKSDQPAYLLDKKGDIAWMNDHARGQIFGMVIGDDFQNITDVISNAAQLTGQTKEELEVLHEGVTKRPEYSSRSFDKNHYIRLRHINGTVNTYLLMILYLEQGSLFLYEKIIGIEELMLESFIKYGQSCQNLKTEGAYHRKQFCVLVSDIQNKRKIQAELTQANYLHLLDEVLMISEDTCSRYGGLLSDCHDGCVVCYFIKNNESNYVSAGIHCALSLKEKFKKLNESWRRERNYPSDIFINIGVKEGNDRLLAGNFKPGGEWIGIGETMRQAKDMSLFAREGSIWTTKTMIQLFQVDSPGEIEFGVRRDEQGQNRLYKGHFQRIMDIIDIDHPLHEHFREISPIPITEIIGNTD